MIGVCAPTESRGDPFGLVDVDVVHDRHELVSTDAAGARLERVADRLADIGEPAEPPARLHDDLWAGNRMVDVDGASWLIDPAAHGGHREFDLAMMRLFGGFAASTTSPRSPTHSTRPGSLRRPLVGHGEWRVPAQRAVRLLSRTGHTLRSGEHSGCCLVA